MENKDKKTFLISVIMILFLSAISFWRLRNFDATNISLSFEHSREGTLPLTENIFSQEGLMKIVTENFLEKEEEKKYIRKEIDEMLLFDIPSSWIQINVPYEEEPAVETEEFDILFTAYSQHIYSPAVLALFKTEERGKENIKEKIKLLLEKEGAEEVNILQEEEERGETFLLTVEYSQENIPSVFSSRIIEINESSYLLSLIYFKEQPLAEDVKSYILSSFQEKK
jgi:hypothetical protein